MTEITKDHVEWAVVYRLWLMLDEPPHKQYSVTQTYALFTAILCWVMQRIRTKQDKSETDRVAQKVLDRLSREKINKEPWDVAVTARIARIGALAVGVPTPSNFEKRRPDQVLIALRDAVAHGDARNVIPFNCG